MHKLVAIVISSKYHMVCIIIFPKMLDYNNYAHMPMRVVTDACKHLIE